MTNGTYRENEEKEEKKEKKDEKKKKGVAFKASSSKGKAKQDSSSEDEGSFSLDELDDEKMTLFVKRFGKFMMKKGYLTRRKKSSSKNKEDARCFNCGSKYILLLNVHTIVKKTMMTRRARKRTRKRRK
jgi:hypothetical protein